MTSELGWNKSSGSDGIPSDLYKFFSVPILRWLAILFNGIFCHGCDPTGLSEVTIRSIMKNNIQDPCDIGNYRLIALATWAFKLLKKLILQRAYCFHDTGK